MTIPPNQRAAAIPAQRRAIDGSVLKHRHLVSECLDLMEGLGVAGSEVEPQHGMLFPVDADRLGRPLPAVLTALRPLELRGLHARLTGRAVRAIGLATSAENSDDTEDESAA
jgi:hypothetical protein